MMEVREILQKSVVHRVGTSEDKPTGDYTSWLDYWEKNTKSKADKCVIQGCANKATDGAHIQLRSGKYYPTYIIPTCHSCNMQSGRMTVNRKVKAVLVECD